MIRLVLINIILMLTISFTCKGQWIASGTNIYNTNSGNVGIGNATPATLLHVGKFMGEPMITIHNQGAGGGATFSMLDDLSGANWKFKATSIGGFKIRDHASSLDVIVIEPGSFANALYIKSSDNIGVGTNTPAVSALVDMSSTDKGFLVPRMTTEQRDAIQDPVDGLLIFNLTTGCFNYFISGTWKNFCETGPLFQCGTTLTVNHAAGAVVPVNKTVSYGTVNNVPGEPSKCWITQNLGADHQASAVDDDTEASAGWYWQFNRKQGFKHDGATRTPNTTWISIINENSGWQTVNDPCAIELGSGWRVPTYTEYYNIDNTGGWTNWNGPWGSALKMHAAGYLDFGSLNNRGEHGLYWSNNQQNNTLGRYLLFSSGICYMNSYSKSIGLTVRCVRD